MSEMITLGYVVRKLRLQHELSKKELGDLCEVSEWTIRDVEQRGAHVRLTVLAKMRAVFDISYDELIGDTDAMTRDQLENAINLVSAAVVRGSGQAQKDLSTLMDQARAMDRARKKERETEV